MSATPVFVSPRRAMRRLCSCPAFTLIELLTVIAIVGILAAILIPVVGKVRQSASSAQCAAHMREIGLGMQLFTEEHRGRLPTSPVHGTLHSGQGPWFNREERRLQYLIGTYIGSPKSTTWSTAGAQMTFDPQFSWPAYLGQSRPGAPSIVLNTAVKLHGGPTNINPWVGTRPSATSSYVGRALSDIHDPSTQRVFIEVDQKNTTAGWKNLLPPGPVHGSHRNALFFDWHVAKVPVVN